MTAQYPVSRDIQMSVSVGNCASAVAAEAVSWSPDVADDMARRALQLLREAMEYAASLGVLCVPDAQPVFFDDGANAVADDEDE